VEAVDDHTYIVNVGSANRYRRAIVTTGERSRQ
jgi:hypothetical protein